MNENQGIKGGKFETLALISALGKSRQKVHEVDAALGHTSRPCLKNPRTKKPRRSGEEKEERKRKSRRASQLTSASALVLQCWDRTPRPCGASTLPQLCSPSI